MLFRSAAAASWGASGGWLAFGALVKVYPGLLAPAAVIVATRRARLLLGAAVVAVVLVLPFMGAPGPLLRSVVGYQLERGLQVESLWATGVLVAHAFGYPAAVEFNFGSFHLASGISGVLKLAATLASVALVAYGTWLAARRVPRGSARGLAEVSFAIMAGLLVTGSVLSPQFLVWAGALGASCLCWPGSPMRRAVVLLGGATLATQLLFPFLYLEYYTAQPAGLALAIIRGLLLIAAAWFALAAASRRSVDER